MEVSADDLRLLLAVARTGRKVTAGSALGLDRTTVSRRIQRLERALDATLLVRAADGWELTHLGQRIVERAAPIEEIMRLVQEETGGADSGLRGTIRIAAPDGFGVSFMAPTVAAVKREHPALVIELVTSARPVASRGAGYDMIVSIGAPPIGRLLTERLTPYALGLYASRDYLDRASPIRTRKDLSEHAFVFYVDSLLSVGELDLMRSFSGTGVGLASTNVLAQLEATRHGAGIGLLPGFLAEPAADLVPVLADEVSFELDFLLSYHAESRELPAVQAIRGELLSQVEARRHELIPAR